jgi:monoterpene epsilon-lactone hydrolase
MLIALILSGVCFAIVAWGATRLLRGEDLSVHDKPRSGSAEPVRQQFSTGPVPNHEHRAVMKSLSGINDILKNTPRRRHLGLLRAYMDDMTTDLALAAQFVSVDAGGVSAEWALAPGVDANRRTLYIHGGAWMMGSPRSHRVVTTRFSEITGGAVLAIDYRLMPEHSRLAGIEDCRTAYQWMLGNGPEGPAPAAAVYVAGDSAGGNLTLSLIAWVRDQRLRAPDAAVALSPATDATLGSPTLKTNLATDAMLGPLFGRLAAIPRPVLLWTALFQNRMRPCNPVVSPVFGDLSGLPRLLIHASDCEMLLGDSIRYANKAAGAGSDVTLQTWQHVMHVWHIFYPQLTESREAFEEIRKFLSTPGRSA